MKPVRFLQLLLGIVAVVSGIMLYSLLKDAQWPLFSFKGILAMLPELGLVFEAFELEHSAKANEMRSEANDLREEANNLRDQANQIREERNALAAENNELKRQLDTERNQHLAAIATHVQRPQTRAEVNAARLRTFIGSPVVVFNADDSRWGNTPNIVDVSNQNILTLFQPARNGSRAFAVSADCNDVELTEVPQGACPIRIKINRRYGADLHLGEITRWEDRNAPAAEPRFDRDGAAYNAQFSKPGSPETRSLFVYPSRDGSNSFQLQASTGETFIGNNKEVSIRFLAKQVDYLSEGFRRGSAGTGASPFPLFIC